MEIILAIGAAHAFYLFSLNRIKNEKTIADQLLGAIFIIYGIVLGFIYCSLAFTLNELLLFLLSPSSSKYL